MGRSKGANARRRGYREGKFFILRRVGPNNMNASCLQLELATWPQASRNERESGGVTRRNPKAQSCACGVC
eukprot:scaffold2154_cov37-Tisochrysis_lutea.AAC.1